VWFKAYKRRNIMPSQINNPGNIGYADGITVSANYLKAKPSTRFGTRQLAFFNVAISNVHVDYRDSDSLYSRAVRAIQVNAEIYAVGTPASDNFIVVVAQDTANDGENTDDGLNPMAQTLSQVTGGTVTAVHLSGTGFAGGLMAYGDTSSGDSVFKDEGETI
jgi:hypothetical protein